MDASPAERTPVPDLADAVTELAQLMLATASAEKLLDDLARLAARVVTPSASCGVTLRRDGQPLTVATSDALAGQVDQVQYGEEQGPCLHSLHSGEVVTVTDLATDARWPDYRVRALGYGVRSSLSLPLTVDGDTRGALNLYAPAPDAFADGGRQRAETFAVQGSAALTILSRQSRHTELTQQLRNALASRSVIDQAIGILMGQQRCDADRAFGLLRGASQHQNRKLRDIAADIVRTVGGADPRPGPFRDPD
ncbi:MAG TPA: GAF and ANTAR domain-containing protein [Mycobacteriales bacterium]|jgi:GAF domain-containing protein|nr:GAF and ANTAR domain-containing protein [Mycobacteriales bacterium]